MNQQSLKAYLNLIQGLLSYIDSAICQNCGSTKIIYDIELNLVSFFGARGWESGR